MALTARFVGDVEVKMINARNAVSPVLEQERHPKFQLGRSEDEFDGAFRPPDPRALSLRNLCVMSNHDAFASVSQLRFGDCLLFKRQQQKKQLPHSGSIYDKLDPLVGT